MRNLNFFSAVLVGNDHLMLCVKSTSGVTCFPGKTYSGVFLEQWKEPSGWYDVTDKRSRFEKFKQTFIGMFESTEKVLFKPEDSDIEKFYEENISEKIKESPYRFHAMIGGMEETGKIFNKTLEILLEQYYAGHKKILFTTDTYMYPEIDQWGHVEFLTVNPGEFQQGKFPVPGKDFFCKDTDLEVSNHEVFVTELLKSIQTKGGLAKKFGRGLHMKGFEKFLSISKQNK
jgi:hypothetical protein